MEFPMLVAKVLAVYFAVSGVFLLTRRRTLPMLLKDFFSHPAIVYLAGVLLITFGLILAFRGSEWDGPWRTLVTIFGALAFLKGVAYIFFPQALANLHVERSRWFVAFAGVASVALGVWLWQITAY